jgi:hypothetical protein
MSGNTPIGKPAIFAIPYQASIFFALLKMVIAV